MGRSSEAHMADLERRMLAGEFDHPVDPYDHDVAIEALRRIAAECVGIAAETAKDALARIEVRKEP